MKIGKLVSINYSQLKVKISSEIRGGSVNLHGSVYYFGNIGSYLKITNAIDETIVDSDTPTANDVDETTAAPANKTIAKALKLFIRHPFWIKQIH